MLPFYHFFELTVNYILQHTPLEQLDRKHFAKILRTKDGSDTTSNGNNVKDDMKKEIALMEVKMRRLCELLDEVSSSLLPVFMRVILDAWYTHANALACAVNPFVTTYVLI